MLTGLGILALAIGVMVVINLLNGLRPFDLKGNYEGPPKLPDRSDDPPLTKREEALAEYIMRRGPPISPEENELIKKYATQKYSWDAYLAECQRKDGIL